MLKKEVKRAGLGLLSLLQVFLCRGYTCHENRDEFVVFFDERGKYIRRFNQRLALDNVKPYECLSQFFQSDLQFVNEVLSRFSALRFAIIGCC